MLKSTTKLPLRAPASTPSGPRMTVSTSAGTGTQRQMMSVVAAASAEEAAAVAPLRSEGLDFTPAAVVDGQREAGLHDIARHGQAPSSPAR